MITNSVTPVLKALLLLGPTGSGKTPLGNWLETHGLGSRPCHHFDFGANLRAVVQRGACADFFGEEIHFLQDVLERGALLEDESFYLAEKILKKFIESRICTANRARPPMLVLNGFPRHIGQAQSLEKTIHVSHVLQLECEASIIRERLQKDTGGDRQGRSDDTEELVARKLQIYRQRSQPLLAYYEARNARIILIPVGIDTQPEEIAIQLEAIMNRE
jgi:adenylate kinase family enzyme